MFKCLANGAAGSILGKSTAKGLDIQDHSELLKQIR